MTTTIAVAGKGGTGKTTVCAMVTRYLIQQGFGPVLAIDADPSSNLNLVLGLPLEDQETVGHIREDMLEQVQTLQDFETQNLPEEERDQATEQLMQMSADEIRQELIDRGIDQSLLEQIDDQTLKQLFLETLNTY